MAIRMIPKDLVLPRRTKPFAIMKNGSGQAVSTMITKG